MRRKSKTGGQEPAQASARRSPGGCSPLRVWLARGSWRGLSARLGLSAVALVRVDGAAARGRNLHRGSGAPAHVGASLGKLRKKTVRPAEEWPPAAPPCACAIARATASAKPTPSRRSRRKIGRAHL